MRVRGDAASLHFSQETEGSFGRRKKGVRSNDGVVTEGRRTANEVENGCGVIKAGGNGGCRGGEEGCKGVEDLSEKRSLVEGREAASGDSLSLDLVNMRNGVAFQLENGDQTP